MNFGKLDNEECRLVAYIRGVGGACEFVQLHRSSLSTFLPDVVGSVVGVSSAAVAGSTEMDGPGFCKASTDSIVNPLFALLLLYTRVISGRSGWSKSGMAMAWESGCAFRVGVGGLEVFHIFCTHGFCL